MRTYVAKGEEAEALKVGAQWFVLDATDKALGRLATRAARILMMIAHAFKPELTPNERVYAQLVIMQIMLAKIAPGNHWAQKLRDLLAEHPAIPIVSMGFPTGWHTRRIWGLIP